MYYVYVVLYACVKKRMYERMYARLRTCTFKYSGMHTYMYVCIYIYIHIYHMYIYIYVYMDVSTCTYVYVYMCMYVCRYVCMYVCMHSCMHVFVVYNMKCRISWNRVEVQPRGVLLPKTRAMRSQVRCIRGRWDLTPRYLDTWTLRVAYTRTM